MDFSIVIPTYNRAGDLRETLKSLARLAPEAASWETIIADNNSSDETKQVVAEAAHTFPVALHYVFEGEQGRSAALNAGIRQARGAIIVNTDDDVRVAPDWLDCIRQSFAQMNCDYIGGKVVPIWGAPPPAWLPVLGAQHYSRVLAVMHWGEKSIEFGSSVPLGVNIAFKREAFERVGLWDNRVGRKAGTLLGQEVREWVTRALSVGVRGFYAPQVVVHHIIPAERLHKRYFRRWFYWHGISRALMFEQSGFDVETMSKLKPEDRKAQTIAGVPRHLVRKSVKTSAKMLHAKVRGDEATAFAHELWLCFFAGVVKHLRGKEIALVETQTTNEYTQQISKITSAVKHD